MDQRERLNDHEEALRTVLRGWQAGLWTAMPGILQAFDAGAMTAKVQPSVQGQLRQADGTWKDATLPLCLDCPVIFPAGGGFALTFPLAQGDEGLLVFASRCIDAWWASGGVQKQPRFRMHDLSDGFFLPGCFSQPRKLANINTSFPELRNAAGTIKLAATEAGFMVTGTLQVTGGLQLGGNITALDGSVYAGDIHTSGEVIKGFGGGDQVTLGGHEHPENNAPPTPGT